MISDPLSEKITYLLIDTHNHRLAQTALRNSQIAFPLKNSLVFSDVEHGWDASDLIKIDPINSVQGYCEFLLKHAWKFVKTEFFIVLQYDGFVLNGDCFSATFLDYDYIGAPWINFDSHNVGNGGFSLRSKKLMEALQPVLSNADLASPEDILICREYRPFLEKTAAIKFAPVDVASRFSQEQHYPNYSTFGFHGCHLLPIIYRKNLEHLFDELPVTKDPVILNKFVVGCNAIGVQAADHAAFSRWLSASQNA
ncbi:hypothetical protein OAV31_00555 [bacterium]|nr:hypothetical protein [bacterium]